MIRPFATLLALAAFVATSHAQPGRLPLAPGVREGSPIGPGTQFLQQPTPRFFAPNGGFGGGVITPFPTWGLGWAVPGYYPFPNYGFGFGYGGGLPYGYGAPTPTIVIELVTPLPPLPPEPRIALANEFPATLTLQFPAAADVWLNGTQVKGEASEERVLMSPVLKSGEQFTFDVKAKWTSGGKNYESARTMTLGSGARSRLFVVSGTEVK